MHVKPRHAQLTGLGGKRNRISHAQQVDSDLYTVMGSDLDTFLNGR